ncbi:alpha/beta fold hydrolase [Modestobacter roseus]|uniref:Pimeloyl-ACP methyl ester carboxylesterase n=1 Tax=Modestobacter roseus TaxID=1181884 RepID=A0A562IWG9_9ACTN|nr:alpha/beta hydrolase [Modestobacter roseus]MQA34934.1 alpha/beta fold hydrolase [Modestobacter roseus]TWH75180.1 pimeloyl-ACP methyl ester carboxylesterase [Modestobacter roseus]
MTHQIDHQQVLARAQADVELAYKLRGFSGTIRMSVPGQEFDVVVAGGTVTGVRPAEGPADAVVRGPEEFWTGTFSRATPAPGYESLTGGMSHGVFVDADLARVVAPWFAGIDRLFKVVRETVAGEAVRKPVRDPYRDTDSAVGRYAYITAAGEEARVYYEQAGTGPIPLLLHPTAGTDGRQYRHLLADPEMQQRFTMYAYDLPYHGKSLPPVGVRWWEQPYLPGQEWLMNWVVAIADHLQLDQPFFMGCSVGGQLALDLAAERGERFGAFVALNGWYGNPRLPEGFSNDLFRTPGISDDYAPSLNFGATAPNAPEPNAHETYWIYRSNFPGIYAGDNDYFMFEHDLNRNGHKIDAGSKPVYVVTGEYDPAADDDVNGGPAVEKNIPGAVSVKLPDLGHFAPCDDPVGFNEAILPVLDEVIARAGHAPADSPSAQA